MMSIPFMTTLDKIIHKYLDLVIFFFGILRKDHKKQGSVYWLKKNLTQSLPYQQAQFDQNFVSLSTTKPLFEPEIEQAPFL